MVFFTCNGCGEALKKNQVEKHAYRCRQCQVLSCVDCSKDFWGNDYQFHTKCITEDEKYCGKGYVPKVNKGEVKQEQWIEKVQRAIEQSSSDPKLRNLLQRLQDYPNIPRKKAKFENFLKNSMRVLSPYLISQVWNVLMEQAAKDVKTENQETKPTEVKPAEPTQTTCNSSDQTTDNDTEKTNGVHNTEENDHTTKLSKREKKEERQKKNKKEKKDKPVLEAADENVKKTKKRKRDDSDDNDVDESEILKKKKKKKKKTEEAKEQSEPDYVDISKEDGRLNDTLVSESPKKSDKFSWGTTILSLLEKKGEISYKKLRRKIMQEFMSQDGAGFQEESAQIKFDKKLRKLTQVVISDGRVSLR